MTKSQELSVLTAFIASLPEDAYLRPWLESVLPDVSTSIVSDIYPYPRFSDFVARCHRLKTVPVRLTLPA